MTNSELREIEALALTALESYRCGSFWSEAYAKHVPLLLAEVRRLRALPPRLCPDCGQHTLIRMPGLAASGCAECLCRERDHAEAEVRRLRAEVYYWRSTGPRVVNETLSQRLARVAEAAGPVGGLCAGCGHWQTDCRCPVVHDTTHEQE